MCGVDTIECGGEAGALKPLEQIRNKTVEWKTRNIEQSGKRVLA